MASDYEDDHFLGDHLKVDNVEEDYEPLRHTQYFNVSSEYMLRLIPKEERTRMSKK